MFIGYLINIISDVRKIKLEAISIIEK